MANTIDFILTNAASELISKVLSGKTLNFTRMAVGDGFSYDTTVAKGYKTLVNEVLSLDITKKETLSASSVKVTSAFKNTDAQQEFYYREVGLYAQDPDTGKEILYAYGNRNNAAELITPSDSSVVTKQLAFIIAVGDSANVTFKVNANVYALQEDMIKTQADITTLNSTKADVTVTNSIYTELMKKANKDEVSNVLTPKGNSLYADLPKINQQVGWYYYCSDGDGEHGAGNYVWNGVNFYFGGTGDEGYNVVKKDLNTRTGVAEITFIDGYRITLAYDVGTVLDLTPSSSSAYRCAIVDCKYNDVFTITAKIGSDRLYAFLDSENKILEVTPSYVIQKKEDAIIAPFGAVKMVINDNKSGGKCYKGYINNYDFESILDISGVGSQSAGTSGITSIGQYYFNRDQRTIDRCNTFNSPTDFTHSSVPTYSGRVVKFNNSFYQINGKDFIPVRSGSVVNIVGKGRYSTGTNGVTKAGQYYVGEDNKLKLCVYYATAESYTDMSVEFSVDTIYLYEGEIYKYTGSGDFEGLVKIKTLDTELYKLFGTIEIAWDEVDKNISIGSYNVGDVVSITPGAVSGWAYSISECTSGDVFTVSLVGGVNPRAWAFLDAEYRLISIADAGAVLINEVIYAPKRAKYLILNSNVTSKKVNSTAYYGTKLPKLIQNSSFTTDCGSHALYEIEEDRICSMIKGIKFSDELQAPITDLKKDGDLMVHVSTFAIINGIIYCTYYANTRSASETPSQHTARFVYCPLSKPSNKTYIDLQDVGQTYDGKTVNEIYDTILLRKDDDVIYLMWTAKLDNDYYRLYRTYTISTGVLSDIATNYFYVNGTGGQWNVTNMISAFNTEKLAHKNIDGDIGIMQKLTSRVEDGTTYYYTGAYVGDFNCIIKSTDLITWHFVANPAFENGSQWENATYVLNDKVYYFVRQYAKYNTGFLTYYDLIKKTWAEPVFINDCQSRSDFIMYGGNLYLIHAPKDRNHISIMCINQTYLNKSYVVQTAKVPDYFYPFVQIYNNELYMSFTQSRQHIYLSKFTIDKIASDTILSKFKTLFLA